MSRFGDLEVRPHGHGHYKVKSKRYGKAVFCITNNMQAIDDFQSEEREKDGKVLIKLRGYKALKRELTQKNKNKF